MKKFLFTAISLVLLASCSVKTNEEKARRLIEPQLKASLIKPNSYEFSQIQLDSCFSDDASHNADVVVFTMKVAKLYKEYKDYMSEAERAESVMTIYGSSYGKSAHDKQQENKYKREMEKAQRKASMAKENILQLYRDNKSHFAELESVGHEFTGWVASLSYRAETAGGLKTMGSVLFFLNKELTEVTHLFTEEELMEIKESGVEDISYEFEKELKEIRGE